MKGMKTELLARMYLVMIAFFLIALWLAYKTIYTNVFRGDEWRALGKKMYVREEPVLAERGNILADDGSLLAASMPIFEIRMDLKTESLTDRIFNEHLDSLAFYLSSSLKDSRSPSEWKAYLKRERKKANRYALIARRVDYNLKEKMSKFPIFRMGKNRGGFIAERKNKREKPYKRLAARTIGRYRSKNMIGLEKAYDLYLKGEDGIRLVKRMPGDIWIPVHRDYELEPIQGHDILTNINVRMQDIADQALAKAMRKHAAQWGTAILMEVSTGAIKAIANLGWQNGALVEDYNYAIGKPEEPGSTFKLATMMALLDDGKIRLEDSVDLQMGEARFYDRKMRDSHKHKLRNTTIRKAFEESSNVGIAKLAVQNYLKDKGATRFIQLLKKYGLDKKSGIDIPGEKSPFIKDAYDYKNGWSGVSLPWISTGYEIELAPIQTLTFYNMVANDGKRVKPFVVKEILSDGKQIKKITPEVADTPIVELNIIKDLQSLLRGVVLRGTAKKLQSDIVDFAGKTGTALFDYGTKSKDKRRKYQASFVGYFPAENPKYSCIVVIRDPKRNGYYGGKVAGPVFKEIAENISLNQKRVQMAMAENDSLDSRLIPSYNIGYADELKLIFDYVGIPSQNQTKDAWGVTVRDGAGLLIKNRRLKIPKTVPDVTGMGLRDATFLLESQGLRVKAHGYGKIKKQSISPGIKILGQEIILTLG